MMEPQFQKPPQVHLVASVDSLEFDELTRSLTRTSLIALDAEWKPVRTPERSFPYVTLLQIACKLNGQLTCNSDESNDSVVFLLDLLSVPLSSIWEMLRDVFLSPNILKLGFRFKQDLIYLSSTFSSQGCDSGFDRIEPFLDITSIYNHLQHKRHGRSASKQNKSLASICAELLAFSLSKELQCSDWSHRPLTEEQIKYAAVDAHCLLEIFCHFQKKVSQEDSFLYTISQPWNPDGILGLKEILKKQSSMNNKVLKTQFYEASDIIRATARSDIQLLIASTCRLNSNSSNEDTTPLDGALLKVVKRYGEKLVLRDSDKKPRISRRKGKKTSSPNGIHKAKNLENSDKWIGPPPWDLSIGGDGYPKFLCDVMVEGLAKHLRCVGIDAAVPYSKKPEPRELIDHALRENRVLLTRDAKLLRHEYLIENQIYKVKSLLKNDQLREVIETFKLEISEDQLMSRCTKCNGKFIQKPLTTEEALEAAKGFQRIPNCLFNKNLEFWQCMDCRQLYWEGTQYHNAVQKFIEVCKLSE